MITFILSLLGYFAVGGITARWMRNVIINHHFDTVIKELEEYKAGRRIRYYDYNEKRELNNAPEVFALKQAKYRAELDMIPMGFVSITMWPLSLPGLIGYLVYQQIKHINILPLSRAERTVQEIVALREREAQLLKDQKEFSNNLKKLKYVAQQAQLDTKGLEAIEQYGGIKSKN